MPGGGATGAFLSAVGLAEADARGVTDGRIGSDIWLAYLFVMSPHPDDFHRLFFWVDLIHESVLDIDPARPRAIEISDQLLICWRALKRILLQNLKQAFCLGPKIAGRQLLGVLQGLLGVIELPGHQVISVLDLLNGSRNPLRIDSRIPGIDRR